MALLYLSEKQHDVYIACSSDDLFYVNELEKAFKEHGITFAEPRSAFNQRGFQRAPTEAEEKQIQTKIANCKIFLFVSGTHSRSFDCGAVIPDMNYVVDLDADRTPASYHTGLPYTEIPKEYKVPRMEYCIEPYADKDENSEMVNQFLAVFFAGFRQVNTVDEVVEGIEQILNKMREE